MVSSAPETGTTNGIATSASAPASFACHPNFIRTSLFRTFRPSVMTRLYLPLFLDFVGRTISETRFRVKKPGDADAGRFLQGRLCSNRRRAYVYQRTDLGFTRDRQHECPSRLKP